MPAVAAVSPPDVEPTTVPATIEWLIDASHELSTTDLIRELGLRLRGAGLPVDRLILHLRTIHPELHGSTLAWTPGEEIEIHPRERGIEHTAAFAQSPLPRMMQMRESLIVDLDERNGPLWCDFDVFKSRRVAQFLFVPLRNAQELVALAFFCTARREGFDAAQRAQLERVVPALRNACELRMLRDVTLTLLDTYVGAGTAQRILAGHIRRGEIASLDTALMLCDLRGFTHLSNELPTQRVIELLDAYFDAVVPAVTAAGGEVLKFIGDAVLAFFHRDDAAAACAAALQGSLMALENLSRFRAPDAELHAGVALHYGRVNYGNIGSGHRLDFTLIGPDVNLLSRIQSVCSTTGNRVVMSERFVSLLEGARPAAIGSHQLKGFAAPVPLYGLLP